MGVGAGIGAGIGALIDPRMTDYDQRGLVTFYGAVVGSGAGLLTGIVIGSSNPGNRVLMSKKMLLTVRPIN